MRAAPTAELGESLELTDENVEMVLDEIRPYLMAGADSPFSLCAIIPNLRSGRRKDKAAWHENRLQSLRLMPLFAELLCKSSLQVLTQPARLTDGGNVELVEIDGPVVYLRLQGACGSCPSSLTTMTMGIKRRLQEKIPVSL